MLKFICHIKRSQVLPVSVDKEENVKFAAENGIDFPLVSDTGKSIRKSYGRGRVTYLIDKDGIIRHVQKGVPKNSDFLNKLEQLQ
jgi:peroxiredoxin